MGAWHQVGTSRPTRSRDFAQAKLERDSSGAGGYRGRLSPLIDRRRWCLPSTGVHKTGILRRRIGHLPLKTPHLGKNQGEVSTQNAYIGVLLDTCFMTGWLKKAWRFARLFSLSIIHRNPESA